MFTLIVLILSLTSFLLAFILKILAVCFFIKFFNPNKKFWFMFKSVLLYELSAFCFLAINSYPITIYNLSLIIPYLF